ELCLSRLRADGHDAVPAERPWISAPIDRANRVDRVLDACARPLKYLGETANRGAELGGLALSGELVAPRTSRPPDQHRLLDGRGLPPGRHRQLGIVEEH